MMEIKFRGLRTDGNGWITGNLFVPNQLVKGVYICETTTFADFAPSFEEGDDIEEVMSHGCALGRFIEVKPETVGQFTGLTDKNGKEIYSGDILKGCVFKSYIVKWDKDQCGFNIGNAHKEYEIIGNKFEHLELLNK